MRPRIPLAAAVLALAAGLVSTLAGAVPPDDYARLLEWRASTTPHAVPEAGLTFSRDVAAWTLLSGALYPLEPLADGTVPGFVFEGRGQFRMTVPDRAEQRQLRRFAGLEDASGLAQEFSRMVLRTSSGDVAKGLCPVGPDERFARHAVLVARAEESLKLGRFDADARIAASRRVPGDGFLVAEMDTQDFGWLQFRFDPFEQEEIALVKQQSRHDFTEEWVRLDRAAERDSSGAPADRRTVPVDLVDVAVEADLTRTRQGDQNDREAEPIGFRTTLTFLPRVDDWRALVFTLSPFARVTAVTAEDGTSLAFLRDHIGERFATLSNRIDDDALVVLLDRPLAAGASRKLTFTYDLYARNYVSGTGWYPLPLGAFGDLHTAALTLRMPKKYDARAIGERTSDREEGDLRVATWTVTKPTKMVSFVFGRKFTEEKVQAEGGPQVVSFGLESGLTTGNMVRNVGADVANSLAFYARLFKRPIDAPRVYATRIEASHGQAFEGFLQLSGYTYDSEHPGASELFRAHEAAHQYWGHLVGWKGYRDQWLSESLAEYSAMLFVEATLQKKGYFDEILEAYTNELLGSVRGSMSVFARPGVELAAAERATVGPIGVGFRASTALAPDGYRMQVYDKGPLVLHMIRVLMRTVNRSDEAFLNVLRSFLDQYAGKEASTADFRRVLETETKSSWGWFFDQWIDGVAIPTYAWRVDVPRAPGADGKFDVALTVRQSDVAPGFRMPVLVRFVFPGNRVALFNVLVQKPEETFHVPMPVRPDDVVFDPDHAVLARVKKM